MFSSNSIVSTVSYSDGQVLSYEEFISNHQEKHNRNVSFYQSSTIKRNVRLYDKTNKGNYNQYGGQKKNSKFNKKPQNNNNKNVKTIKQQQPDSIKKKNKQPYNYTKQR